jgi:hypothetical protein
MENGQAAPKQISIMISSILIYQSPKMLLQISLMMGGIGTVIGTLSST